MPHILDYIFYVFLSTFANVCGVVVYSTLSLCTVGCMYSFESGAPVHQCTRCTSGGVVVVCLQMFAELHCTQVNTIALHCEHQVHFRWCVGGCLVVGKPLAEGPMSLETVTLMWCYEVHCKYTNTQTHKRHSYVVVRRTVHCKYTWLLHCIELHYASVTLTWCSDVHCKYTNTQTQNRHSYVV